MHALIVSNLFPPVVVGGYELACSWIAERLSKSGWQVSVLTSDEECSHVNLSESVSGIAVGRRLWSRVGLSRQRRGVPEWMITRHNRRIIESEVASTKPDFLFAWNLQGLGGYKILSGEETLALAQVHYLMDRSLVAEDPNALLELKRLRQNRGYQSPVFAFCSEHLRRQIMTVGFQGYVWYPFIKFDEQIPVKHSFLLDQSTGLRGVYLGQIAEHKGIYALAKRVSDLHVRMSASWTLHVFSPNAQGAAVLSKLPGITVEHNLPRHHVLSRLSSFDVGYFPSTWNEPFGMAQAEMLMVGLPVVTTGRGGSIEAASGAALIADPPTVDGIVDSATRLLDRYSLMAPNLSRHALSSSRSRYGYEVFHGELCSALAELGVACPD